MKLRFKHEVVNVTDLIGKFNIPVVFQEEMLPAIKSKSGYVLIHSKKVPSKRIVLTSILGSTAEYTQVNYIEIVKGNINRRHFYVPTDFKFNVLTGLMGKSLVRKQQKEIDELALNNLDYLLEHKPTIPTVGCDPEIFVEDDKGEIIPAFNFLPSKKDSGYEKIYWDGFQAEFETNPDTCLAYHVDDVHYKLQALLTKALKFNPTAKLSNKTVIHVPHEVLESTKEEFVQLGCMPSFNAYDMKGQELANGRELTVRSAGGHIHFGCNVKDKELTKRIVKALDAILGVACVSLFAKYDNPMRRNYYGLAGEYRTPAHGIEYRTLSNAWLTHPYIMNVVFDLSRKAFMMGHENLMHHWKATEKETIECINNCDVELSHKILERNKDLFIKIIKASNKLLSEGEANKQYDVFINGIDLAVNDSSDFVKNWTIVTSGYNNKWIRHCEGLNKNTINAIKALVLGKKVA